MNKDIMTAYIIIKLNKQIEFMGLPCSLDDIQELLRYQGLDRSHLRQYRHGAAPYLGKHSKEQTVYLGN
jgi:hypothetical protein